MQRLSRVIRPIAVVCLVMVMAPQGWTDDGPWVDLTSLESWKTPGEGWTAVSSVALDPSNPKKLIAETGTGVIYNGPEGTARNLISKQSFGDVELHAEFMIPKGSNSGIKFQSVYEIQIFDSFQTSKKLSGSDNGGVYPRSELKPKYHHIDEGYAPITNASKAPGEWQSLEMTFIAPRFDATGKKTASARITATLNGKLIQDNIEVSCPTGNAWHDTEKPTGPILLQADHGPVAFRNIKARSFLGKP